MFTELHEEATGNNSARQSVLWDIDVEPEHLADNVDTGFPARVTVFDDQNVNGVRDAGENIIQGATFFVDSNGNGVQNSDRSMIPRSLATPATGTALILNLDAALEVDVRFKCRFELEFVLSELLRRQADFAADCVAFKFNVHYRASIATQR
jgi:hypothetical protein